MVPSRVTRRTQPRGVAEGGIEGIAAVPAIGEHTGRDDPLDASGLVDAHEPSLVLREDVQLPIGSPGGIHGVLEGRVEGVEAGLGVGMHAVAGDGHEGAVVLESSQSHIGVVDDHGPALGVGEHRGGGGEAAVPGVEGVSGEAEVSGAGDDADPPVFADGCAPDEGGEDEEGKPHRRGSIILG
jgi:hypothetical protein